MSSQQSVFGRALSTASTSSAGAGAGAGAAAGAAAAAKDKDAVVNVKPDDGMCAHLCCVVL
jgi:hypothetical protein